MKDCRGLEAEFLLGVVNGAVGSVGSFALHLVGFLRNGVFGIVSSLVGSVSGFILNLIHFVIYSFLSAFGSFINGSFSVIDNFSDLAGGSFLEFSGFSLNCFNQSGGERFLLGLNLLGELVGKSSGVDSVACCEEVLNLLLSFSENTFYAGGVACCEAFGDTVEPAGSDAVGIDSCCGVVGRGLSVAGCKSYNYKRCECK